MVHNLSNKEILCFYDLLYRFEHSIKRNPTGYKINRTEVNAFIKKNSIVLDTKSKVVVHFDKNRILYSCSNKKQVYEFIRHIRNSFAHGLISKIENYFIIQDINPKGVVNMYGIIDSNLLFPLIGVLENTKKQIQTNK